MSKSNKHIDRIFQEAFKEFEVQPPQSSWEHIESHLSQPKRRFAPLLIFLKYAAIITAGLLIFGLGALYQDSKSISDTQKEFYSSESKDFRNSSFEINKNQKLITSHSEASSILSQDLNLLFITINSEVTKTEKRKSQITQTEKQRIIKANNLAFNSHSIVQSDIDFETQMLLFNQEQLRKKSTIKSKPESFNSWMINPQIAPIYASSLNSSNTLNEGYASHKSEIDMAYGLKIAYQVTPKLSVRTGVNQVNMNYMTDDIVQTLYTPTYATSNIKSVSSTAKHKFVPVDYAQKANSDSNIPFNYSVGYLNQNMGFLEVPLEIEYQVIDKKIGFHVAAGASTLFLNENQVSFHTDKSATYVGETANLNKTSFSANIGFGVDYNFSEQWSLNVEPNFKYQVNTFSTNSTGAQPYYFGVFSGVKFRF
ncbi:MAG: MSCRAMM family adhesin SdrC [Psychroflexus sp.]|nr:MSCRAMM family adhesin SdrC [Psychroflexus sp.]MDN6309192.1 MSCRAMM family adhesin SdrC [Psychroflexus sp.]